MKEIAVKDEGGDEILAIEHNGYLFPKFPRGNSGIEGLDSNPIREDDIIIATFPKSGTHWTFEITRELVSGTVTGDDVTMAQSFMEFVPKGSLDTLASPRILSTHVYLEQLPAEVKVKKPKIILVVRNPKDVAVSFFPFLKKMPIMKYDGKWETYLPSFAKGTFCYGSWFDYMRSWDKARADNPDLPILTLYYEDMKEDSVREMRKICKFLNLERSEEFLNQVRDNTSIESMRSQKSGGQASIVFRKGQIGDWKNHFTVVQNEWFDKIYQEETKDIHHPIRFT